MKNNQTVSIPTAEPRYLTVPETAARLRMSKARIYQLIEQELFPHRHCGGRGSRVLIVPAEIDAYLAKQTGK